jgi:hypothetical protein
MKKLLMSLLVVAAVSVAGVTYVYGCSLEECGGGNSKCCTITSGGSSITYYNNARLEAY